MKNKLVLLLMIGIFLLAGQALMAQCAMCTKTASQLGEKPAKALNAGILYLLATPFAIVGIIGYRWWKNQQKQVDKEA